jgi:hypothetical protein
VLPLSKGIVNAQQQVQVIKSIHVKASRPWELVSAIDDNALLP